VAADWFYNEGGKQVGPVTQGQICEMFSSGRLALSTLVWRAQFKDWTEAGKIHAFRELAKHAPPPPPAPPPFASIVAPAPSSPPPLPPLPPQATSPAPFGSPVAAPQPVFIPGLGSFAGGATVEGTSAPEMARLYPSPPATSGPPLMTPHPYPEDHTGPQHLDYDGHPVADPSQARPWVRFFARWIDMSLWGTATLVLLTLLGFNGFAFKWIAASTWLLVEAALLSSFGTTMGKSLLGITVRNADGTNLSYGAALGRALGVWVKGQGCNIPILNLVMLALSYNQLTSFGVMSWDEGTGVKVRHEPLGAGRVTGAIAAILVAFGISFSVGFHQAMEKRRVTQKTSVKWQAPQRGAWANVDDN
jgi:uncharacterized RDD family membrane protein YckC